MLHLLPDQYPVDDLLKIYHTFPPITQINITSHDGKTYEYESNKGDQLQYKETDLVVLNKIFVGTIYEDMYRELDEKYGVCRGRIMTMTPTNRAYSYHQDPTKRIHIPLQTAEKCMFLVDMQFFTMPTIGQAYLLDTTKEHTALNLGWGTRIHIMFSLKK